jgi:methylmalonyl-CoA mutase cobalamin-binding domain/chain
LNFRFGNECGLRDRNFELRVEELEKTSCGITQLVSLSNPQSAIRNPQFLSVTPALMTSLGQVVVAVENYRWSTLDQIKKARTDREFGERILQRWRQAKEKIGVTVTPTGLRLPRLALPDFDEVGEIARFLWDEGLPGEFPFLTAAYAEQYLEPGAAESTDKVAGQAQNKRGSEEPTRLFAGLGLGEDTNARFHYLSRNQRSKRLSTAFDGPTLYGVGSGANGVFGKIGEGGVAIDTVDDMERLYAGFELAQPEVSVSMTISGPAPILLAMYIAAAKHRFGLDVARKLRGTIQADVLKEVQAQNELIFPIEPSLRFLADMVDYCSRQLPRWYPISISGYHIAEAGATPVQQAAYTLSNGFAYVDDFQKRGMDVNVFGPRLSFFLDCGLDVEYVALARVCRKIWAIGMRDVHGADERAQILKLHTQTSGRSLIAADWRNNLTRTALELMLACMNATNSCHSNSADEPFTTPSEEYARYAAHAQSILLEESGLFKHMMNTLQGSPGMKVVGNAVEEGILEEFREIEQQGGVIGAVERRYQRSQIQASGHLLERQIYEGIRPVIGLNRYNDPDGNWPEVHMIRTPNEKKQLQRDRLQDFEKRHAGEKERCLDQLTEVVEQGGNVFEELIRTVEHCSLGQITERLCEVVGKFRPMV